MTDLVEAAAHALAGLDDDQAGLVTGCRQMVDRHPAIGPMWWLTSRMLCSDSPGREAWAAVSDLAADETPRTLAGALPAGRGDRGARLARPHRPGHPPPRRPAGACHRRPRRRRRPGRRPGEVGVDAVDVPESGLGAAVADADVVVIEALAAGPAGSWPWPGAGRRPPSPTTPASRSGRRSARAGCCPAGCWRPCSGRLEARGEPWDAEYEVVPLDLIDTVAGPWGSGEHGRGPRPHRLPGGTRAFQRGATPPAPTGRPDADSRRRMGASAA